MAQNNYKYFVRPKATTEELVTSALDYYAIPTEFRYSIVNLELL